MHNEHSKHTLNMIKLVCLWSRRQVEGAGDALTEPLTLVGLSWGGCPSVGTGGGDWLDPCRQAQLDILERSPHPSDRPDPGGAASRWAALFLGHPGRGLKDSTRTRMLLAAASDNPKPQHLYMSTCFGRLSTHTQPNQYHTPDKTYRPIWCNNSCHYNY